MSCPFYEENHCLLHSSHYSIPLETIDNLCTGAGQSYESCLEFIKYSEGSFLEAKPSQGWLKSSLESAAQRTTQMPEWKKLLLAQESDVLKKDSRDYIQEIRPRTSESFFI